MPRYRFYTLDVFTDTPFGGNPLAVVLDADTLSDERMQLVAAEFNLSETVFVLEPAKAGRNRKRVRIFTPKAELPFAGHPTIGTSYLLAELELLELDSAEALMVLEEGIGDVPVKVRGGIDGPRTTQMSVPKLPASGPEPPPRGDLAAMLSLDEGDLVPGHAGYSCGVPFLFLPVRNLAAITRIALRTDLWEKLLSGWWAKSVFVFTTETVAKDAQLHARMFAPAMGIAEDPATGGAASALAGYLVNQDRRDGRRRWLIEQGFEMGRRSLIDLEADVAGGQITAVRVGGSSVLMSEGWIEAE